uniref:Uncharacterized protein n=1 Tax=Rousettus aegyptiacus TaxID=9407 RepID=A0A7J8CHZ9_ROUAE|nr:hypothetical protein HJG63_008963 [Rousettus aegyptiacus]
MSKVCIRCPFLCLSPLSRRKEIERLVPSRTSVTGSGIVPEMVYFENRGGGPMLTSTGGRARGGRRGPGPLAHAPCPAGAEGPGCQAPSCAVRSERLRSPAPGSLADDSPANRWGFRGTVRPAKRMEPRGRD